MLAISSGTLGGLRSANIFEVDEELFGLALQRVRRRQCLMPLGGRILIVLSFCQQGPRLMVIWVGGMS